MFKNNQGFTIVELAIIIVVIGILATISIVSYNGIQDRAVDTAMSNDLTNAAEAMKLARLESSGRVAPTSIPASVKPSKSVVLQLTQMSSPTEFCINANHTQKTSKLASFNSTTGKISKTLCSGALIGSPVGG